MAMPKRDSIHAKCLATRRVDGHADICRKSKGHAESSDPRKREHYDPSSEARWNSER